MFCIFNTLIIFRSNCWHSDYQINGDKTKTTEKRPINILNAHVNLIKTVVISYFNYFSIMYFLWENASKTYILLCFQYKKKPLVKMACSKS